MLDELQAYRGDSCATIDLFDPDRALPPLKGQLLKWIGNKQKFAKDIIRHFPQDFGTYFEPFLGSGAVLAALAPKNAVASDIFLPLVHIWQQLHSDVEQLICWYADRHALIDALGKEDAYKTVLDSYNASPNGADLLFLSRVCYGGVVRFRKADGYMSTPCGPHRPMPIDAFAERARIWAARTAGASFLHADYAHALRQAREGDLVYLDPPYFDSQSILYGAQGFKLPQLCEAIAACKNRGVRVVLSIDGTKKSGTHNVELPIPDDLFVREEFVHLGSSMLKRFQLADQTAENHHVADRLLMTY